MSNRVKSVIYIFLLFFSVQASAQNDFCAARNASFKEGEKLMFKVYYNLNFVWINAGNAYFDIQPTTAPRVTRG